MPLPLFCPRTTNQGFGRIKGSVKKTGLNYSNAKVCCFNRVSKTLIWEVSSDKSGTYLFRNIAKGLECFVIAFDPANQFNAVIQDNVVPK